MDAVFRTFILVILLASGCQTMSTDREPLRSVVAEPVVHVPVTLLPTSVRTVSMPRSEACLEAAITRARQLDRENDVLRHIVRQTEQGEELRKSADDRVQTIAAMDREFVVWVNGMSRVMIPLDVVQNTILARLPLDDKSSVLVMQGSSIIGGQIWQTKPGVSRKVLRMKAGVTSVEWSPTPRDKAANLGQLVKSIKVSESKPLGWEKVVETARTCNAAVIYRTSGQSFDQVIVPLNRAVKTGSPDTEEFDRMADIGTGLIDKFLIHDGDVIEFTRFDRLPLVQGVLLSLSSASERSDGTR